MAHFGSKFLSIGVGTQKIEGKFEVRNVTMPIVAAEQVTDRCQGVWLSGSGGFILDVKSAKKVEKLLGDKRGLLELRKQKGVCVIPCEDASSSLFQLIEKELDQRKQMDKDGVEVQEDKPAIVRSAPVIPTENERGTRGHARDVPQLLRGMRGRTCNRRRSQTFVD